MGGTFAQQITTKTGDVLSETEQPFTAVSITIREEHNLEQVSKNHEFCIKNEKWCIKNEGFCIKNDEFAEPQIVHQRRPAGGYDDRTLILH